MASTLQSKDTDQKIESKKKQNFTMCLQDIHSFIKKHRLKEWKNVLHVAEVYANI